MASNHNATPAPTFRCRHMSANDRECRLNCREERERVRAGGAFDPVPRQDLLNTNEETVETAFEVKPPKVVPVTSIAEEAIDNETETKDDEEVEFFNDGKEPEKFKKAEDTK